MPSPAIPSSSSRSKYLSKARGGGGSHPYSELPPPTPSPPCSIKPPSGKPLERNIGGRKRRSSTSTTLSDQFREETSSIEAHRAIQVALAEEKIKYKQQDYSPYYKPSSVNSVNTHDEKCSPYYKGLLAQSSPVIPRPVTPTRESHATTSITWTSFSSSFIVKLMQELTRSSCCYFKPKRSSDHSHHHHHHHNCHNHKNPAASKSETTSSAGLDPSFLSSSSKTLSLKTEERKKMSKIEDILVTKEKPLRESLPEPTAEALVLVPTTTPPILTSPQVVTADQEEDIKHKMDKANKDMVGGVWEFTWAKKYQPHVLEDFICNKGKATQLLALVILYFFYFFS